jgi:hypothetical protein
MNPLTLSALFVAGLIMARTAKRELRAGRPWWAVFDCCFSAAYFAALILQIIFK